jgi:hypothetical protein
MVPAQANSGDIPDILAVFDDQSVQDGMFLD